eukprot:1569749-Pleurochrysis_carterae.AAC.1
MRSSTDAKWKDWTPVRKDAKWRTPACVLIGSRLVRQRDREPSTRDSKHESCASQRVRRCASARASVCIHVHAWVWACACMHACMLTHSLAYVETQLRAAALSDT